MVTSTFGKAITHYIGIDISKQWLDLWLRPDGQHLRCSNDAQGFQQIHRWLSSHGCTRQDTILCLEDTGIYGKRLVLAMTRGGWACAVEKTTILDKVGPEHHRKDDRFDARLLAEYADRYSDQLTITTPAAPELDRMQQLYSERRRLVRQRTATKTKQTQSAQQPHCPELLQEGWRQQLALLDRQIATLEEQIQQLVDAHEGLSGYYRLLTGIPGVGQVTAWLWLIIFYGQQQLNPQKIASRFGVAPHSHSSGSSVQGKTRSSGHGASEIRSALTMAAVPITVNLKPTSSENSRKASPGRSCAITW